MTRQYFSDTDTTLLLSNYVANPFRDGYLFQLPLYLQFIFSAGVGTSDVDILKCHVTAHSVKFLQLCSFQQDPS